MRAHGNIMRIKLFRVSRPTLRNYIDGASEIIFYNGFTRCSLMRQEMSIRYEIGLNFKLALVIMPSYIYYVLYTDQLYLS